MIRKIKVALSDYTNLIIVLLLITTFSGALRKWGGLSSIVNNLSLLIMMMVPLYLIFIFKNKATEELKQSILSILKVFCFSLFVLAVNPLNHTLFHGLFGILIHLTFISILLSYFKNEKDFNEKKIIRIFFLILSVQLALGTIQYLSPSDSSLNIYADNTQDDDPNTAEMPGNVQATAIVGDAVRVTGTFSYLGGYTSVLFFLLLFSFYLAKTKSINYIFLTAFIFYGALLSGSRGAVAWVSILTMAFLITERSIFLSNVKLITYLVSLIFGYFLVSFIFDGKLALLDMISHAYENFMTRVENSNDDSTGRLLSDLIDVFVRDFEFKYFGVGLGAAYQGANALFGSSKIVASTPTEGELFRIIVEGGVFLLLFRLIFLGIIFRYLKIPLFLKVVLFMFICLLSQNVFHIYNSIYFSTGLIILNQAYNTSLINKAKN